MSENAIASVEKKKVSLESALFISGAASSVIGLLIALICLQLVLAAQLSAYDPPTAYIPFSMIGLGICMMTGGCAIMADYPERKSLPAIATLTTLSVLAVIISLAGNPQSWTYPGIGYLLFFFILCQLALTAIIFLRMATKKPSSAPSAIAVQAADAVIPDEIVIDEEPVTLKYWARTFEGSPVGSIESGVSKLIQNIETIRNEFDKQKTGSKAEQMKLLRQMIETVDAFDRIFNNLEKENIELDERGRILLGNFRSVRKRLMRSLEWEGVTRIDTDMAEDGMHVISDTRPMYGVKDYTILETIVIGYLWNGEVLRKAEVIVVKN